MNREREMRVTSSVLEKIRKVVPMNTGTKVIRDKSKDQRKDRKQWKQDLRRYEGNDRVAFVLGGKGTEGNPVHALIYKRFMEIWKDGMGEAFQRKLDVRFGFRETEPWMRVYLYTEENVYHIVVVRNKADLEDCYMGCTMVTRKSLPTEDHNRGRDFPDGDFTSYTLEKIIAAILANELLDLSDYVNQDKDGYVLDEEEEI